MDVIVGSLVIALAVGTVVLCIGLARLALEAARRNARIARAELRTRSDVPLWSGEPPVVPPASHDDAPAR